MRPNHHWFRKSNHLRNQSRAAAQASRDGPDVNGNGHKVPKMMRASKTMLRRHDPPRPSLAMLAEQAGLWIVGLLRSSSRIFPI